jgi:hypothetical protein
VVQKMESTLLKLDPIINVSRHNIIRVSNGDPEDTKDKHQIRSH